MDDIEYLKLNTRYDEKEIREWFSGFMAVCPLGLLTMDNIYDMYAMPKHRAKIFINQIFKLFDKNNSGEITFRQFVLATNMTSCSSPTDKLKWTFKMFDADGSGSIDAEELTEIITTLYEVEGKSREAGEKRAQEIFKLFDEDGDGEIDEAEFCNGCQKDEEFYKLISDGVSRLGLETENHKQGQSDQTAEY